MYVPRIGVSLPHSSTLKIFTFWIFDTIKDLAVTRVVVYD